MLTMFKFWINLESQKIRFYPRIAEIHIIAYLSFQNLGKLSNADVRRHIQFIKSILFVSYLFLALAMNGANPSY